jgi:hypothetical protein
MRSDLFHLNGVLRDTIAYDPGLSEKTKELFLVLVERECVDVLDSPAFQASETINQFCTLLRKNYVWIEGFPPPPRMNRTTRAIRFRGLKALITGREQ